LTDKSGCQLVIGGVIIPFNKGADAHSDGDAVYHRCVTYVFIVLG
jgi:2C-methyl-D-erythritol 2,4-cyclodiphosphate synthase